MENAKEILEKLLKSHDWWYMMSDDPRSFDKGRKEEEAINLLKNKVSEEEYIELYNANSPKEFHIESNIEENKTENMFQSMKPSRHNFVKRYGKDAEKVMYGRARNIAEDKK